MQRIHALVRLLVPVVSLVLGGLVAPARASASPINPPVGDAYKVQLSAPAKVCTNEYFSIRFRITHFGLYNTTTPGVQEYRPWGNVAGTVSLTGLAAPLTQPVGQGGGSVRTRWSSPGTRTVTGTATGLPSFPGGRTPTADPDTIQIEVKDCDYTIRQMSVWYHMPEGWNWWVGAVVPPTRLRLDPGGVNSVVQQTFDGFAIPRRRECVVTTTVTGVTAIINWSLPATDKLHYRISYTRGNAATDVVCNGIPGGNSNGPLSIDAIENDVDVGDICWPLPFTCLARAWPVVKVHHPHVAHAISDLLGVTHIILEKN